MSKRTLDETSLSVWGQWRFPAIARRLEPSNRHNPLFKQQYAAMEGIFAQAVHNLEEHFSDVLDRVYLDSDVLAQGGDLRRLPYGSVVLGVVLRGDSRTYALQERIAQEVFAHLPRDMFLPQFRLINQSEWQRARSGAHGTGDGDILGLPLLERP